MEDRTRSEEEQPVVPQIQQDWIIQAHGFVWEGVRRQFGHREKKDLVSETQGRGMV